MGKPEFPSGLDVNNQRITQLADPTSATDAVNRQFLEAFVRGLSWKDEVRAASTANVSLAAPGTTLDGVTLVANDRVLLKNQTAPAENGVYVWTASGSALTRALDIDTSAEFNSATVSVMEGTVNANTMWVQTADNPTVGTTAIAWVAVGAGSGFTVAGAGLTGSGSTVDVGAGTGISVAADAVAIDVAVVPRYLTFQSAASATWTMTHSWNSRAVVVSIYRTSDGTEIFPSLVRNLNDVVVTFPAAVGADEYRSVLIRAS
jgi:hypothetical protein